MPSPNPKAKDAFRSVSSGSATGFGDGLDTESGSGGSEDAGTMAGAAAGGAAWGTGAGAGIPAEVGAAAGAAEGSSKGMSASS